MGTSEVTDAGKNMREYMCLALALITCQTPTTDSKLKRTNKQRTPVTVSQGHERT